MKKIVIVTDNLRDQINGVVTTYKNMEAFAIRDNYNFIYLDPGRFRYFSCPGYDQVKIAFPWKMGKILEEIDPDYIHIATEGPLGLYCRQLVNKLNYRYSTAYHTKFPEGLRKLFGIPESITWPLIRWFHSKSSKVLTTTESMVKSLKEKGFKNKIVSWTRGVDRNIFYPMYRNKVTKKITLLCVSRVSKEKNLEVFFELDIPNAKKIMVGDGPMRSKYEKLYPDIEFVGFKTGRDLAMYYNKADVFVFPSKWETFGLVMIESMACGTPVAAYPTQGPLDVIMQGQTGFMHESLKTAVENCLSLPRHLVYKGSLQFSWENAWKIFKIHLIEK